MRLRLGQGEQDISLAMNWSPRFSASFSAACSSAESRPAGTCSPPCTFGRPLDRPSSAACRPATLTPARGSRRLRAVGLGEHRRETWAGSMYGLSRATARLCASASASWNLVVSLSSSHGIPSVADRSGRGGLFKRPDPPRLTQQGEGAPAGRGDSRPLRTRARRPRGPACGPSASPNWPRCSMISDSTETPRTSAKPPRRPVTTSRRISSSGLRSSQNRTAPTTSPPTQLTTRVPSGSRSSARSATVLRASAAGPRRRPRRDRGDLKPGHRRQRAAGAARRGRVARGDAPARQRRVVRDPRIDPALALAASSPSSRTARAS